ERAGNGQFRLGNLAVLVANGGVLERAQCGRRNGCDAVCIGWMRLTSCMPHLQEYTSTLGMDCVDHPLPALNVFLSINSGRLNVSNAELGYGRCVGNEQPAVRRTLRVVRDHEVTRDVARLSPHSRERREHNPVLQMEMSDFGTT